MTGTAALLLFFVLGLSYGLLFLALPASRGCSGLSDWTDNDTHSSVDRLAAGEEDLLLEEFRQLEKQVHLRNRADLEAVKATAKIAYGGSDIATLSIRVEPVRGPLAAGRARKQRRRRIGETHGI